MAANDSAPIQPLILFCSMRGQCVWGWRSEQLLSVKSSQLDKIKTLQQIPNPCMCTRDNSIITTAYNLVEKITNNDS